MGKANNFNRVARRLPSRLKMALNHNGSPHNLQWIDSNQMHRPVPSLPRVLFLERPDPDEKRPEAISIRRVGIVVEI